MDEVLAIEKVKAEAKNSLLLSMAKLFAPTTVVQPPPVVTKPAPAPAVAESKKDDREEPPYMIRATREGFCDCSERWFSGRGAPTADDPCPYCDGDSR